jgi:hypothetical protein
MVVPDGELGPGLVASILVEKYLDGVQDPRMVDDRPVDRLHRTVRVWVMRIRDHACVASREWP